MKKYENLTREELEEKLLAFEKQKQRMKEAAQRYVQENQEYRLLHSCKGNAKRKGVPFSLEIEDIKIPKYCPIIGVELTNTSKEGRVWSNASVDRLDSTKGYTPDNIWIISDLANRMKQNATKEQLILFARGILKLYGE